MGGLARSGRRRRSALGASARGALDQLGCRVRRAGRATRSETRRAGRCTSTVRRALSSTIQRACRTVYVIQGFTGQVDMWLSRAAFEPNMIERLDAMFAARACPDAIVVFVDAWTSRGGSQFINSASTGRYLDYLCDEVVPFVDERYPTLPSRDHRGLAGKSSGGYGAMVVPMLRAGRVRRARLARRRRAVRVLLSARVPRRRADAARPLRRLLRGASLSSLRDRRPLRLREVRRRRSRCTATRALLA